MRKTVAIVALLMLSGFAEAAEPFKCPHTEFSKDDYQRAALHVLPSHPSEFGRDEEGVKRMDQWAADTRPWAWKIEDVCMRDNMLDWIDYFQAAARRHLQQTIDLNAGRAQRDGERMAEDHRQRQLIDMTKLPPLPEIAR